MLDIIRKNKVRYALAVILLPVAVVAFCIKSQALALFVAMTAVVMSFILPFKK